MTVMIYILLVILLIVFMIVADTIIGLLKEIRDKLQQLQESNLTQLIGRPTKREKSSS
jgi:type III secretory pathway component EscS